MTTPAAGYTADRIASNNSSHLDDDHAALPHISGSGGGSDSNSSSVDKDSTVLDWDSPSDPGNPYNWSLKRKRLVTGIALLSTLLVPLNGTSITVAAAEINQQFGISDATFPNSYWPVASWSLGGALFVIVFLPLMEDIGIRIGFIISYVFFFLMIIPQALANSFATLIITRFFSGGCVALLANTIASVIPDVWADDRARSIPVGLYIVMIFYIQLIMYGALAPLFFLLLHETRGTVILRRRAQHLRKTTHRSIYTAAELHQPPLSTRLLKSTTRPAYLLLTEPVLLASTLWSAFSFGTVFLFTQSTAQVYSSLYGWPAYRIGYLQIAVVIGEVLGWFPTLYSSRLYFQSTSRNREHAGSPIPEARLYLSVLGSFVGIAGGMFVYAWTAYPSLPWIAPTLGLGMVGFGIQVVVTAVADYITDIYAASGYAGSAVSAVAAGENVVAAFLPLAAQSMYSQMGFQWASTLLGVLAVGLSFAPVVFIVWGRQFRARSPFMRAGGEGKEGVVVADEGEGKGDV
ncbi:hypothetical protein LTR91_004796 [Friedmanniomyces endolithicus]|uniref:Major facilitator superfamily (MFS) profile domain-containing protein n=1 Tax=Friedmanniomyces endolithicus TaxID=329885 RepID=A0AAN6KUC9_9PEZI|nr:hypothetical protein LTR57_001775 [Friedmanniomyces endolithicus]KAK1003005.1 hypothetical protein LTR91_004796 [Friedmanniomyces endolithicus]KAK1012889.1 hypothetical protein LTS01_000700 [Friedmanniomyces endolithicus]KAK1053502.1 hypothetical protein LTS16_001260 [Friedmanniomyces endolithicus]